MTSKSETPDPGFAEFQTDPEALASRASAHPRPIDAVLDALEIPMEVEESMSPFTGPEWEDVPTGLDRTAIIPAVDAGEELELTDFAQDGIDIIEVEEADVEVISDGDDRNEIPIIEPATLSPIDAEDRGSEVATTREALRLVRALRVGETLAAAQRVRLVQAIARALLSKGLLTEEELAKELGPAAK